MLAAILICGFSMSVTSCVDNSDNPVPAKKKYRLVQRKEVYDDGKKYMPSLTMATTSRAA